MRQWRTRRNAAGELVRLDERDVRFGDAIHLIRQRIERAKKLLTSTDKPIKEIAALCGYCNAGYFTNTFHAETGLTPKAWRRANQYGCAEISQLDKPADRTSRIILFMRVEKHAFP